MDVENITPPRINTPGKGGFWRQLGMIILGITIFLTFTLVAASLTRDI